MQDLHHVAGTPTHNLPCFDTLQRQATCGGEGEIAGNKKPEEFSLVLGKI
ncbi:MAG: hypothetical protein IPP48_10775 [Chitinophagaceae bacterium]|nr:hypothetical protein [Chitinophagaceae bacterium]